MSKEQDAAFFRNFTAILVALAVFGIFAAIMGKHYAAKVNDSAPATTAQPAPTADTSDE